MRVLITGARGFVGPHLIRSLLTTVPGAEILATCKTGGQIGGSTCIPFDVTDYGAARDIIEQHRPSHIIHLAAMAALGDAVADPMGAWNTHVFGTLNVARAAVESGIHCCFLLVSSGLIYGSTASSGTPLTEGSVLAPVDDYAVTKAAADLAVGALRNDRLQVIRVRPFNHTGPGQREAFAVASFAAQIARIEAGVAPPIIRVGNLDSYRDYLDVRDVVAAYVLVATRSEELGPNPIFNVASGQAWQMRKVLDLLIQQSRVEISVEQDPSRMRPSDLPLIIGDATCLRKQVGWEPRYDMQVTLKEVLEYARMKEAARTGGAC